tara:strand:- start:877 stop:1698 length:822 start_codon:yes stop_codon:yes gene_type:complete
MTITTDVENYPGYENIIQGPWLMDQMKIQAEKVGTEVHNDIINKVDLSAKPFVAFGDSGNKYISKAIIIATGATARWLNLKSEKKFTGFGISACATCDGFFFKDKEVAVIGGGNSAAEEALYLTNFASKVTIIHRRDKLRSEKILQDRLFKNKKINFLWNKTVEEFVGKENPNELQQIILKDVKNNSTTNLEVSGAFIAIGHDPATSLFKNQLKMDKDNYIVTKPDSTSTNIEGVYAAGDVKDKIYRQAVTAAGMGCMAALEAEKYIADFNSV